MKKTSNGFTIVEVAVVLAIAGLIITLVFIGVGQANKSSRDAKRRQDASYLETAMEQWAQNNNGTLPTFSAGGPDVSLTGASPSDISTDTSNPTVNRFIGQNYMDLSKFVDPLTNKPYQINYGTTTPTTCPALPLDPNKGAQINIKILSSRDIDMVVCLESGYAEITQ